MTERPGSTYGEDTTLLYRARELAKEIKAGGHAASLATYELSLYPPDSPIHRMVLEAL